ncbi:MULTISPECIES: MFS transporter [unclassified Paraburkholderia]|uniref:MFS transporter n=1 Tax=unclassified Paraburkholderia TaxID=2615204 RepID=UPI0016227FE6|nr:MULTISPECIES: MFS transporter [unclassified Paraburkholderia]MBB5410062.1 AAHS family cis,cis-muconate transporter-like MFS transporter [Paraburkholderia sp. HC6.4b]MBB5452023.1 AAHS family cis,cis-muconate transporter-like MFS transporter [Paraburkholderia sp. Kb1A]MBB5497007.1 AAHS family cis,cis-muconate transporter-like MFS transporter [Paraburkholderia sp. MM5384-R2]
MKTPSDLQNYRAVTHSAVSQGRWVLVFVLAYLALIADGADVMMYGLTLSRIKDDFGLTNVEAGALGSLTLLGMAIGGIVGGWASDRLGRVRVIAWALALFSLGAGMLGFTHSFVEFAAVRFISSLGIGCMVLVTTLVAEYVPTERRSLVLGMLQTGISAGYIVVIALSNWILPQYGWRTLYYVSAVPVLLAFAIKFAVPEPAAWLASRAADRASKTRLVDNRYAQIFRDRQARTMFILWTFASTFVLSGFYGLNNWLPTYLEKELHIKFSSLTGYMIGTYVVAFIGKIFAGWLGDRWSRRGVYVLGCIGAALFLPVIIFWHTHDNISTLMLVFGFLYGVPLGTIGTFMSESFATSVRGTAVGGSYNLGRFCSGAAPIVIGFIATQFSIGLGFLVVGAVFFLSGVTALFVPDRLYDTQH